MPVSVDPAAAGNGQATVDGNTVDYAWGYGGSITYDETAGFTITPYTAEGITYVIDTVVVDGVAKEIEEKAEALTIEDAESSVFATFAYTVNFTNPANGALSVSRDSVALESGDIVRGGDILTITATPNTGYTLEELTLTGITANSDGTYTVTAENGDSTPAITASFASSTPRPLVAAGGGAITFDVDGAEVNEAIPGNEVLVNVTAPENQVLTKLTYYYDGLNEPVDITESKQFTMPDADVTVTAEYATVYRITTAGEGVSFTVDGVSGVQQALPGAEVVVTVTAPDGNVLTELTYSYNDEDPVDITTTKQFTMPEADVTITATYMLISDIEVIETVQTAEDLYTLAFGVNAGVDYSDREVTLAADIDLSGLGEWTPIGTEDNPFTGTFDGGGHTVSGLRITRDQWDESQRYIGLFGYIRDSEIRDLTVDGNIEVTSNFLSGNYVTYYAFVGSIVGYASSSEISGCTSYVEFSVNTTATVGGIVGYTSRTTLSGCINFGKIDIDIKYPTTMHYIGGIVGNMSRSTMTQCANYADIYLEGNQTKNGDVFGNPDELADWNSGAIGGLVGSANGSSEINESKNAGDIAGDMQRGAGLLGYNLNSVRIVNCYNTGNITADGDAGVKGANSVFLAGLATSATSIENCYSTGTITNVKSVSTVIVYELTMSADLTNVFGAKDILAEAQSFVGASDGAFVLGASGLPILAWEAELMASDDTEYTLTFSVTPNEAEVTLYSDLARTAVVASGETIYTLSQGTYFYEVSAEGYVTETGSVTVFGQDVARTVELRSAATVTFLVSPADAEDLEFIVTDSSGSEFAWDSTRTTDDGYVEYIYTLYDNATYYYSAYATGYNGLTKLHVAVGDETVTVELTESGVTTEDSAGDSAGGTTEGSATVATGEVSGDSTITSGGVYYISDGATGKITISTTESVTLVGAGVGLRNVFEDLYIECTQAGTDLTLKDVYIASTKTDGNVTYNMIDFTGAGNTLTFAGTSVLDWTPNASGYAMIHVGKGSSLTITGGTAYIYKYEQGAGIGGDADEYNGTITIEDATLFMKGSKQGALIGAGATVGSGSSGAITIEDSELYLITDARGPAIGSGAGGTGSVGPDVSITDSVVSINVNFTGAAIGGGGYESGNDADGGSLSVTGSSVRAYIDENAASYWGVSARGVNGNAAITAEITADGTAARLLEFDTSSLSGSSFSVYYSTDEDSQGSLLYSGGLHRYGYINEDVSKYSGLHVTPTYTMDNWVSIYDPCLYLYVPAEDTLYLTVGSQKFLAEWDDGADTYVVTNLDTGETVGGESGSTVVETPAETETVIEDGAATVTVDSESLIEAASTANSSTRFVISGDLEDEEVTSVTVEITTEAVQAVTNARASIQVDTPLAQVTLATEALADLTAQSGSTVTVTAEANDDGSITIAVAVDGAVLDSVSGGLKVAIPVEDGQVVVLVDADGTETVLRKSLVEDGTAYALLEGSATLKVEDRSREFTDVSEGDWYKSYVDFVTSHELFYGVTETEFAPDAELSRAMLVTVLYQLEDAPELTAGALFPDVEEDEWYEASVAWASDSGIVAGYPDGSFQPNASITREQLAVMLYQYAGAQGLDLSASGSLSGFADGDSASDWAAAAMQWAIGNGVMGGKGDGVLDPQGTATRAEAAVMLRNMVGLLVR